MSGAGELTDYRSLVPGSFVEDTKKPQQPDGRCGF